MSNLPDLEGLAIFAKVAEHRAFAGAADALGLSKATVSKAVARLERRIGARLFNRTSRRIALTDAGRALASRAEAMLAAGEAAEDEAMSHAAAPRGLVRLAAPMSFGVVRVAPLLPEFLRAYPEVSVDLQLSDAFVDIIGEGFDAALRIAALPDSSLLARRLCDMPVHLVAAPAYLKARGRPKHPMQLSEHVGLCYSHGFAHDSWSFRKKSGEVASVRPQGPLLANNGDALLPAILAGIGIGALPEFIARDALKAGKLEILLPDWSLPSGALHWVTPPGGPRPRRVQLLGDFLAEKLGRPVSSRTRPGAERPAGTPRSRSGYP